MRSTVLDSHREPTELEIQKAAYFLWLELGCPPGRDQETWFAAKEKLRHRRVVPGFASRVSPPSTRRALRTELTEFRNLS